MPRKDISHEHGALGLNPEICSNWEGLHTLRDFEAFLQTSLGDTT
jgi:hypothetical protein